MNRQRIHDSFARQTLMATLGATLTQISPGAVTLSAPILPSVTQQQGFAHGAVAFALGDSAAGYAALTLLPEDREVVTSDMQIHFLAPAQGGPLIAKGCVIKPGRRRLVVRAEVHCGESHVATLTGAMVPVPLTGAMVPVPLTSA